MVGGGGGTYGRRRPDESMPITGSKEQPLHSTPVLQTLANFFQPDRPEKSDIANLIQSFCT
jgi:hypothetical protein